MGEAHGKEGDPIATVLGFPHRVYSGSRLWRVSSTGVSWEGSTQVFRTRGEPLTVRKIMRRHGETLLDVAERLDVPAALLLATVATESGGRVRSRRNEPGFTTEDETPHRVSAGLTQTLLSTARESLGRRSLRLRDLYDPETSLLAGASYIAIQSPRTYLDPVAVAASYNAGGLYRERSVSNPWRLRCWPLGTGEHISRFVRFYGDSLSVLGSLG